MSNIVEGKLLKAMNSIQLAITNYRNDNKLLSKCDIDYARENLEESVYLILAQLEEEGKSI